MNPAATEHPKGRVTPAFVQSSLKSGLAAGGMASGPPRRIALVSHARRQALRESGGAHAQAKGGKSSKNHGLHRNSPTLSGEMSGFVGQINGPMRVG